MGVGVTCIHTQVGAQHESSMSLAMLTSHAAATGCAKAIKTVAAATSHVSFAHQAATVSPAAQDK